MKFFISSVALLLTRLENTLAESLHEHKHLSTASDPKWYPDRVASPLYVGTISILFLYLFIYIGICIDTYLFHGRKRDPELFGVVQIVPLEKHI